MIEFIFELLLQLVLEIVAQVVFELLAAFGLEAFLPPARHDREDPPVLASLGQLVLGVCAGGLSLFIVGWRVTPRGPVPGLSLILSPLGTGAAMHLLGEHWRDRGRFAPRLFSFRAGAIFAFGMALVRFLYLEWGWTPF
jgi:hypothetical protein